VTASCNTRVLRSKWLNLAATSLFIAAAATTACSPDRKDAQPEGQSISQAVTSPACSFTVTKNVYDKPEWWGTITFRNDGPASASNYKVEFDLPENVHCTAESVSVPPGATLTPLTGSNPPRTVSNHCVFSWSNAPPLAPGASKTFNYSADAQTFTQATSVVVTDLMCGGGASATCSCPGGPVARPACYSTAAPAGAISGTRVLFVVPAAAARCSDIPNESDRLFCERLETRGAKLTVVSDGDSNLTNLALARDLVVVAESVSSTHIGNKLTSVPVAVVSMEARLYDDLKMTAGRMDVDFGYTVGGSIGKTIDVLPSATFSQRGSTQVYFSNAEMNYGAPGRVAVQGAKIFATLPRSTERAAIFAYETGAALAGGGVAPAPRGGFFAVHDTGVQLTPDGWSLFDQLIDSTVVCQLNQCMGVCATNTCGCSCGTFQKPSCFQAPPARSLSGAKVLYVSDGAPQCTNLTRPWDRTLCAHFQAAGAIVTTVNGAVSDLATRAASFDLVFVSEGADSSDVDGKLRDVAVPVVTSEPLILDDLRMVKPTASGGVQGVDFGFTAATNKLDRIFVAENPFFGPAGSLLVLSQPRQMGWGAPSRGTPAQQARIIASLPDDGTKATVFAYAAGDMMAGGIKAPAARAAFFALQDSPDFLTADGFSLLDRMVAGALSCQGCSASCTSRCTTGCAGKQDGDGCDDGDPCNGGATCSAGICQDRPVAPKTTCDDGDPDTRASLCEGGICRVDLAVQKEDQQGGPVDSSDVLSHAVLPTVPFSSTDRHTFGATRATSSVTSNGAAQVTVPIRMPPGRAGLEPALALSYTSGSGDGPVGVGWGIAGLSQINRCPKTVTTDGLPGAIKFDVKDALCWDGRRLVLISGTAMAEGAVYRTEEDAFAKIIAHAPDTLGPTWFEVRTKDGRILHFGDGPNGRIEGQRAQWTRGSDPIDAPTAVTFVGPVRLGWALSRIRDRSGNAILFKYKVEAHPEEENAIEHFPDQIVYTTTAAGDGSDASKSVTFGWIDRASRFERYVNGLKLLSRKLLKTLTVSSPGYQHTYTLGYDNNSITGRPLLGTVEECDALTSPPVCLPATKLDWELGQHGFTASDTGVTDVGHHEWDALRVVPMDLNGDGRSDLLYTIFDTAASVHRWKIRLAQPDGTFGAPTDAGLPPYPSTINGEGGRRYYEADGALNVVPTDINLDGKADLMMHMRVITGQSVFRIFEFDGTQFVAKFTSGEGTSANPESDFLITDVDGDVLPDIFRFKQKGGINENTGPHFPESDGDWHVRGVGANHVEDEQFINPGTDLTHLKLGATHVVDTDGDGVSEILTVQGQASAWYQSWAYEGLPVGGGELPSTIRVRPLNLVNAAIVRGNVEWQERQYWFFDPNGDGLSDALMSEGAIAINSGNGFSKGVVLGLDPLQFQTPSIDDTMVHAFDYDGDGRDDMMVTKRHLAPRTGVTVLHSKGRGVEGINIPGVPKERRVGLTFAVLDRDGDGNQELIYFDENLNRLRIQERTSAKTDLLRKVTDGQGDATEFVYERLPAQLARLNVTPVSCAYPSYCVPAPVWVVQQQTLDAAGPSPRAFEYRYQDSRSDLLGRGWLGFGKRIVSEVATGVESEEQFDNATRSAIGFARPVPNANFVELFAYPFAGKTTKTITRVPLPNGRKGTFLSDSPFKLFSSAAGSLTAPPYYFVAAETSTTSYYEGTTFVGETPAPPLVNSAVTQITWDPATGNVTHRDTTWSNGDKLTVDTTYDDDQGEWLLGRPKDVVAVETTALGDTARRESHLTYEPGTHLVHTRTRGPAAVEVIETFDHNPDGTLAASTRSGVADMNGTRQDRKTSFLYLDFDRSRPSHLVDGNEQTTRLVFNPGTGQTIFARDPNGHESRWFHDGMARLITADLPDDGDISYAYETPVKGVVAIRETRGGGSESIKELDRLGRVVLTKERQHGGKFSRQETAYDARGRVLTVSPPFFDGDPLPASLTTYVYDNLDRPVSIQPAGLGASTFVYESLKTTATTPVGSIHELTLDQLGRAAQRLDKIEGRDVITKYVYLPFDQLKSVTDPLNNVTSYGYDAAGRLSSTVDPDSGTSSLIYNAFDEVISETRANRTRTSRYDILGRQFHADSPEGPSDFVWDLAEHGQGFISSAVSPQGIQNVFEYDAFSRLQKQSVVVGANTYSVTSNHDQFGRLQKLTYPESTTSAPYFVTLAYSPNNGALITVLDPAMAPIWKATEFDAWGRVKESTLGTKGKVAQTIDAFTGFLRQTVTQSVNAMGPPTTIEDLGFKFDDDGRLLQRTDQGLSRTEDFVHDAADRISTWTKTPLAGARTVMSYTYDDLGNLKKKIPLEGGGSTETFDYEGAAVSAGPHAITKSPKGNYRYDGSGNRTSDPAGTMTYTFFDLPIQQKRGTATVNFQYDAFEQRVTKQTSAGGSAVYVGGLFELRTEGGQTFEILHLPIPDGARGFVRRMGTSDQLFYASTDHLGSTTAILDGNANLVERRRTDPWGLPSAPINQSASPLRQLFTGQEHDAELDAINFNGRIYDPYTTRFHTPDPVISDVYDFASYNRYAYVSNSPLNFTDPTGFQPGDEDPVAILRAKAPPPVTTQPQQQPMPIEGPSSGSSQGQIDPSFLGPPSTALGAEFTQSEAERLANPSPYGSPAIGGGDAAAQFAKGVAVGAATSVATTVVLSGISALCPVCGAVIGVALLAKTIYDLANGGLSGTIESAGRIFSGEGTAEDYYSAGALLGGIAGGKAMGGRGVGPGKPAPSTGRGGGGGGPPMGFTGGGRGPGIGGGPPGGAGGGGGGGKPPLSAYKKALKKVHGEVDGPLPPGKPGKFGSPQRGDSKKGYRLDPPHARDPGDPESKIHINFWDYTQGKRGKGGKSGAVPVE
jgi:RHS repeat-associated protein